MPEVSSVIEASGRQLIPNSLQNAHVISNLNIDPNTGKTPRAKSGLSEQVVLDWEVDEGEFAGRIVRFNNLSLNGQYKDKKTDKLMPMNTKPLCDFLAFTGVPWQCNICNNGFKSRKFYIATGDDGLTKGTYHCPDCKNPTLSTAYNTDNFLGARCAIKIGSKKKPGSDDENNEVVGYAPVRTYP